MCICMALMPHLSLTVFKGRPYEPSAHPPEVQLTEQREQRDARILFVVTEENEVNGGTKLL